MRGEFFSFSVQNWPLFILGLIPAVINFAIFVYVLFWVRRSSLSTVFLFFLLVLIMWRLQESTLQICTTQDAAAMWYHMFSISTNFIGAVGLHFVLILINKDKWRERHYHFIALYLPTFLFSMFFASGTEYMRFSHTEYWGWVFIPSHPVSIAAFVLIGIHASMMIGLLAYYTLSINDRASDEYKRARLILFGSSTPIIIGIAYQIVLPIFFNFETIPVASSLVIFFSLSILIAITKYDFLVYSPVHQWENIVENMNEGILITDKENAIQYVNTKFCDMLGYKTAELVNRNPVTFLETPNQRNSSDKITFRKTSLFRHHYELEMIKKDGTKIICSINAQPYLDSSMKVVGTVAIYSDITRQIKNAKKIRESESKYRNFVENATDGIIISDTTGNFLDVNAKACQLLGYTNSELLKLNIGNIIFKEDIEKTQYRFNKLLTGKVILFQQVLKRKDESAIPAEINARMLPDNKLLAVVRDVTERIKSEEALLEKVNEMDAFIYRASHDLRGPLASISGLTSIGKSEVKDKQATFYFEKIGESVTRLDNILLELNKIARVTQAKLTPVEIDLKKEIGEILTSVQHLPNSSRVNIKLDINVSDFYSDKIVLIITLQNLIINAINYCDEDKEESFLYISGKEYKNVVEIILRDNGLGIPKELQNKVFEMFFRGTSASKGSGLGLYIVKNAIKKLNGSISLESNPGAGTTFIIRLPKILPE